MKAKLRKVLSLCDAERGRVPNPSVLPAQGCYIIVMTCEVSSALDG